MQFPTGGRLAGGVLLLCVGLWSPAMAVEVLGQGTQALIGYDATDPEGDGDEACVIAGGSPLDCGFNATFQSNNEPSFSNNVVGGEQAFNVFDNLAGSGDTKWCCDGPSAGGDDPASTEDETGILYVQATFAAPIVLHAFTLSTGNDIQPARDPDIWALQGSSDGITYTDIFRYSNDGTSPFTAVNQVLLFKAGTDYTLPPAYAILRLRIESVTSGTQHHLNELELFDAPLVTEPQTLVVDGTCTLREAILAAQRHAAVGTCPAGSIGEDTIVLNVDTVLTGVDANSAAGYYGGSAGLPDITEALVIRAGTHGTIARDPALGCEQADANAFRLLQTFADLTLDGLLLENGCIAPADASDAEGAAVLTIGAPKLVMDNCVVRNNQSRTASSAATGTDYTGWAIGGAVSTNGTTVMVSDCRFEANIARVGTASGGEGGSAIGGAMHFIGGTAHEVRDSVFTGNAAYAGDDVGGLGGSVLGGALYSNSVIAVLERLVFTGNLSDAGDSVEGGSASGAVEFNQASRVSDVLLRDNIALGGDGSLRGGDAYGGGMSGRVLEVSRVTAAGNQVLAGDSVTGQAGRAYGGGMSLRSPSPATVDNLTLSGNVATGGAGVTPGAAEGAALYMGNGTFTLQHVTAIGNTANAPAGATASPALLAVGTVSLGHGLLQQNAAVVDGVSTQADCGTGGGTLTSLGYNLVEAPAAGCTIDATGDVTGLQVSVHALSENACIDTLPDGSCLPTIALHEGSIPALDAGACAISGVTVDARGMSRPLDLAGYGDGTDDCDIGAFEAMQEELPLPPEIFSDGFED